MFLSPRAIDAVVICPSDPGLAHRRYIVPVAAIDGEAADRYYPLSEALMGTLVNFIYETAG